MYLDINLRLVLIFMCIIQGEFNNYAFLLWFQSQDFLRLKYCIVLRIRWRKNMNYLIYLKRSFKLRLKRHMILHVILTCAIILPLIISIYRDSIIFGQQLLVKHYTHGQTYHILNAKLEHLEYFKSIPGLSSFYEDNTIFINIMSVEDANNPVRKEEFNKTLISVLDEIKDEKLILSDMSHFGSDESYDMFPNQLLFVNAFIMLFSLIIVQSAYKNHLDKFTPDIGILVSCGAKNDQIQKIFLYELLITFLTSVLSAVSISSVLMYILFHYFLQVKDVGNLTWLIFRINPINLLLHILAFGIVLLLVIVFCLKKKLKQTSIKMLNSYESGEKAKHYSKMMTIENSSVKSLGKLLSHRTKRQFINCLMISIPITITVIFIFNYLIINIENISKKPDFEITIHENALISNDKGISKDDISFVKNIAGIKNVKEELNLSTTKYIIKDDRMEGYALVVNGNDRYSQTFIRPYNDIEDSLKSKDFSLDKYNVAVNKNHEYLKYKIGDKIYLYLNEIRLSDEFIIHDENEQSNPNVEHEHSAEGLLTISKPIELTVVQLLDYEWTDRMFPIYFTDEMFLELTRGEAIYTLQLKLDVPSESDEIVSVIQSKFDGIEYTITNNYEIYEKNSESSTGVYIMALVIFGIMFVFILVILHVKLSDYVETQSKNIRLFYILGASKSDIYDSYMQLPLNISMFSIVVSFIIGLGFCNLFFRNTGYHLLLNITTTVIHLIITMLILAAYIAPVHSTLKKKLKQL